MIVRLLLAVSMLAGPTPARFCTCGAIEGPLFLFEDGDHEHPHHRDCPASGPRPAACACEAPVTPDIADAPLAFDTRSDVEERFSTHLERGESSRHHFRPPDTPSFIVFRTLLI